MDKTGVFSALSLNIYEQSYVFLNSVHHIIIKRNEAKFENVVATPETTMKTRSFVRYKVKLNQEQ